MTRKQFLKLSAAAGAGAALTGLYTWKIEPFWLEFVYQDMPVKHLPKHLEGKTLMQISDVHVGKAFDWQYLIDSFQKAKLLQPDFVVYTGDYVSYDDSTQIHDLNTVMQHAPKGKLGTVGVLGNHDYGDNWEHESVAQNIIQVLQKNGIPILRNEKIDLNGLHVIGIDDFWSPNFKPDAATQTYKDNEASLCLCHNPDACDLDAWNGYQGWILSGHTHGGQCKAPFLPPPILPVKNKKYSAGKIDLEDGRTLYINRALGNIFQVRFNVRPEITLFKLFNA